MRIKLRKILHKTAKFFGFPEDSWARLGGRNGKKRSYGHFSSYADGRTRAEKRDASLRKHHQQEAEDLDDVR